MSGDEPKRKILFKDTTLRDGNQDLRVDLSVDDKLRISTALAESGLVHYIEGGWPGANRKDEPTTSTASWNTSGSRESALRIM